MKIYTPGDSPAPNGGRAIPGYDKAKEAAIEKQLSQYIVLVCGHFTTWEMDELFSFGRPARNKMWCEKCGKWKVKKPRPKTRELPSEPLF